ncbi:MAG: c-type cytochrome domain-containing protein [Lacipirellulaceae bacterium]
MKRFALTALLLSAITPASFAEDKPVNFETQILPILDTNCVYCHGPEKAIKKLRLDSAEQIQAFHEDELIVAGKPAETEHYERLILPEDHKKLMPKDAGPLEKEDIELIRKWIAQGASFTSATVPSGKPAETKPAAEEKSSNDTVPEDSEELKDVKPASAEAIKRISATGASVMPLFGKSALLQVSFAQDPGAATQENLQMLTQASEQIVWLNLAGAQVNGDSLAALAKLPNISQLHLEKSAVDDAAIKHLSGLNRLTYLNLYGTQVSDAGLLHIAGLKRLRKLYVWDTKVSYDGAMALEKAIPGLSVNLGWNHPVVAKKRIEKQLASAKKEAEEAKKQADETAKAAARAKEANERAAKRLKELNEELKALQAPPAEKREEAAKKDDKK